MASLGGRRPNPRGIATRRYGRVAPEAVPAELLCGIRFISTQSIPGIPNIKERSCKGWWGGKGGGVGDGGARIRRLTESYGGQAMPCESPETSVHTAGEVNSTASTASGGVSV